VITSVAGSTVSDSAFDAVTALLSVTCTVNVAVPGTDGVPLITPVVAARLSPCGNVPCVMVQVTGVAPPDWASVAEYGVPALPFDKLVVVITGLDLMVSSRIAVSVAFFESVTREVNKNAPGTVGVPPMIPCAFNVRPGANVPLEIDHWYGGSPPLADRACE